MAIKYFTNRPQRAKQPVADRWMAKAQSILSTGSQDLNGNALDTTLSYPADWKVNSVELQFSTSQARDYTVSKQNGRKVVQDENDYLWFIVEGAFPTKITLDEGFYTGTELAAHLKTKLDAAFTPTFTVDYNSTNANKFTIVPDSGTIRYIDVNLQANFVFKQSIAGHLFGFEEDSVNSASLASDTEAPALDASVSLFSATADTSLSVINDDGFIMDIDQGLRIEISDPSAACVVDWTINYEERV